MNSKEFLTSGVLVPVGLSASSLHAGVSPVRNIRTDDAYPAKIKISLNAFSFDAQLRKHVPGEPGGMSLFDLLEYCARVGFDAIDPTGYYFPGYPDRPDAAFISNFKREAHQLGVEISGTGIKNDFSNKDKAVREAGLAMAKEWVEVAAAMGAPVLRVFVGLPPKGVEWKTAAGWAVEALVECAEYGKQAGVIVAFQNHADMIKTAEETLYILNQVNSEWLGLVADTGSFITDDPYHDIEQVIPYAVNWQLKGLLANRRGGPIDVKAFTQLLVKHHYRGYVPIEALPERGKRDSYNPYEQVEKLYTAFRSAIEETGRT